MAKKTPQTKKQAQLLVKFAVGEMVADNRGCSVGEKPTVNLPANAYYQRQHALALESALSYVH